MAVASTTLIGGRSRRRPEFVVPKRVSAGGAVAEQHLTVIERVWNQGWVRKSVILLLLAAAWQLYALHVDNALLLPTFLDMTRALWRGMASGDIPERVLATIEVLL